MLTLAAVPVISESTTGNCTWRLTGAAPNYTLSIFGNGAMGKYAVSIDVPWYNYRTEVKTVVIADGVTHIGDKAFYYCSGLTSVIVGNSVTSIGNWVFGWCTGLTEVTNLSLTPQSIGDVLLILR
jgi:hypothetical protein